MKVLFPLLCAAALAAVPHPLELTREYTYDAFLRDFPRTSALSEVRGQEYTQRASIYARQLEKVLAHNEQYKAGKSSWFAAINRFSDWNDDELKTLRGYRAPATPSSGSMFQTAQDVSLPASRDWKAEGRLTPVKNQMECGSCWAFAATEGIESSASITSNRTPVALSVGQIVQCTPNKKQCGGSGGCQGANCELAFEYVGNTSGITTADEYPYTSGNGRTGQCHFDNKTEKVEVVVTGYTRAPSNDRAAVQQLLAQAGPLSIAVDASQWGMYGGGVFDGCNRADKLTIDHGVQVVAYATQDDSSVVWTVRNSWGGDWGESGFIRLADSSSCKADPDPASGTMCPPFPPSVRVCGPCGLFYDVTFPHAKFVN
eukprot:TRINITY_DN996_c0_g1_i1.p1 TRINITY_DN996_c0_g1~~TRINITY_DN996_c0_g1_i1.p1  ORF type:complete len:385 (-),score=81.08 TRINITY_DN996_c0_g1_i1:272-1387(-)